jgi:hypothetical protein
MTTLRIHPTAVAILLAFALAVPAAMLSAATPAAPATKPGLWELSSKMSSSDGKMQAAMSQMQQQLANMPPEQRRAMQQMMEKNGVQMDVGSGGAIRTRMCMTREMAERRELPVQQGDCTQKATQLSPTRTRIQFTCTKPRASGEGEVTMDSDTSYHARMKIRSEERQQTVDMDVSGAWLSADCGSLRPVSIPSAQ